jgi:hypothetical protein
MSDATLLPELLRRESRSYLHYIRESFPYARGSDEQLRAQIVALAAAEDVEIARVGRLLQRRRITLPFFGSFPVSFTSSNFLSISYVLPRLVADQKQMLADLERDLKLISEPELHAELESFRDLKRKNLQALETLVAPAKAA